MTQQNNPGPSGSKKQDQTKNQGQQVQGKPTPRGGAEDEENNDQGEPTDERGNVHTNPRNR